MTISRRMLIVGVVTLALVLVGAISLMVALGGSPATAKVAAQVPVTVTVTPTPTVDIPTETATTTVPTHVATTAPTQPAPAPTMTVVVTKTVTASPIKKPASKPTTKPATTPLSTPTHKLGEIYERDGKTCTDRLRGGVRFTICANASQIQLELFANMAATGFWPTGFQSGCGDVSIPKDLRETYDITIGC